jgi:hypothetical protein
VVQTTKQGERQREHLTEEEAVETDRIMLEAIWGQVEAGLVDMLEMVEPGDSALETPGQLEPEAQAVVVVA